MIIVFKRFGFLEVVEIVVSDISGESAMTPESHTSQLRQRGHENDERRASLMAAYSTEEDEPLKNVTFIEKEFEAFYKLEFANKAVT